MYAIVEVGGRQYRVAPGERLYVERLAQPAGSSVELPVLLLADDGGVTVGKPFVEGKTITAQVVGEVKGEKLVVFKYTPKKRYRRKTGHRQKYTLLLIGDSAQTAQATSKETAQPTESTPAA
jgi:large subunit ribosomal protein L21